jgi:ribosomal protein S18 acetylase RimI-like enzyme
MAGSSAPAAIECGKGVTRTISEKGKTGTMKNRAEKRIILTVCEGDLDNKEHCRALVALINEYRRHPMGGALPAMTSENRKNLVSGLRQHPASLLFFAKSEKKKIVGAAVCFFGFSTFAAKPLINIHDLIVASNFRSRGVATALMEVVAQEAAAMGCCKVTLEVRADNRIARRFYRSIGFKAATPPMDFWAKRIDR